MNYSNKHLIFSIILVFFTLVLFLLPVTKNNESMLTLLLSNEGIEYYFVFFIPFIFSMQVLFMPRKLLDEIATKILFAIQGCLYLILWFFVHFSLTFSLSFSIWGKLPENYDILNLNVHIISFYILFISMWYLLVLVPYLRRNLKLDYFFRNSLLSR